MKNNNDNRLEGDSSSNSLQIDVRLSTILGPFKARFLLLALIVFSLWLVQRAQAYEVVSIKNGVSIKGKVHIGNSKPLVKRYPIFKNQKVCGKGHRDIPLVQANGDGLLDTIIYLVNISKGKPYRAASKKITINQLGCRFIPHLSVMANGGEIEVINSDATMHNIHTYELVGTSHFSNFSVSQPQRGDIVTKEITTRRGMGLSVTCDAHNFMQGFVFLARNPYYAVVNSEGMFSIDNVPPGTYVIKTWHGTLGERTRTIIVPATGIDKVDFYY